MYDHRQLHAYLCFVGDLGVDLRRTGVLQRGGYSANSDGDVSQARRPWSRFRLSLKGSQICSKDAEQRTGGNPGIGEEEKFFVLGKSADEVCPVT